MNQQETQNQVSPKRNAAETAQKAPATGDPASVHPVRRQRTQKNQKRIRVLQRLMIALIALVLLVGILLIVMPMFRVKTVIVEGASPEHEAAIAYHLGISEGDEIFSVFFDHLNMDEEEKLAFYSACPYVKNFEISYGFSTVTITVVEG